MNRRSFAESLALVALAPVLGVSLETLHLPGFSDAFATSPSSVPPSAGQGETAASLVVMLVEIIRLEYGSRLSAADLAGVADQIRAGLDRADLIRRADRSYGA